MEIFDAHVQMGPALRDYSDDYQPIYRVETSAQLLGLLDRSGIRRAVVFAPRWHGGDFIDPEYQVANEAIREAVAASQGRMVGFCRVNPCYGKRAQAALERGVREQGFRGLYLDPERDSFNVNNRKLVGPLMAIAQAAGVPVLVDTGYAPAEPGTILELATAWPTIRIIMGHMGQRLVADSLLVAARAENVILETSQCVDSFIHQSIKRLGAGRLIWGSGIPFHIPEAEILKITRYRDISDADKAAVLGGNLAALLGMPAAG